MQIPEYFCTGYLISTDSFWRRLAFTTETCPASKSLLRIPLEFRWVSPAYAFQSGAKFGLTIRTLFSSGSISSQSSSLRSKAEMSRFSLRCPGFEDLGPTPKLPCSISHLRDY